ncbi:MAG TPA: CHAD domain-containing protein [Steroidobacteraceae bacterium]
MAAHPRRSSPAQAHPGAKAQASTGPRSGADARANGAESGAEAREVEWQLTAEDLGLVRRWLEQHSLLDELSIQPLPPQQLHDTYLDTEDWRVLRAGFALRLREKAGRAEATLKGLSSARDDVADRREITEPVFGRVAKAVTQATGPVGRRVRDVTGTKPLRTLFDVRTTRQRFAVRSRESAADLGEIALDEARFSRGNGHRRPLVLTRVELEASGTDASALERLAQRLCAECELHRATENKFAVGLRSAALEPPQDARPDRQPQPPAGPMAASTRAAAFAAGTLHSLLRQWQADEPAARLGESPEALHKLRVAGRRMDTVLRLFSDYLPASLARSQPTLKGMVDALGDVRDADIRLQEVRGFGDCLGEGERAALEPLLRHLQSERARAQAALLSALDAKPARHWLDTLPGQLARIASSAPSRSTAALTVVPYLIGKRYRKLRECAGRLTPRSAPGEFHKARIRAKKLRYAIEVIAPTYTKPADRMIAALQKLQNRLGTQHDAHALAAYLAQLASDPPADFTAATLYMMGRMAEQHAAQAARLGRKIEKPWRKIHRNRWKALRTRMRARRGDGSRQDTDTGGKSATSRGKKVRDSSGKGRLEHSGGNGKLTGAAGTRAPAGLGALARHSARSDRRHGGRTARSGSGRH